MYTIINDCEIYSALGGGSNWGSNETDMKQLSCFTFCSVYTELRQVDI